MTVLKHRGPGFAAVPDVSAADPRLSFQALGILTYLLSKPEGWDVRSSELVRSRKDATKPARKGDGRDGVRRALTELKGAGYYATQKVQDPGTGKWATLTFVSAVPWDFDEDAPGEPGTASPAPVAPGSGSPGPIPPFTEGDDTKSGVFDGPNAPEIIAITEQLADHVEKRGGKRPKVTRSWWVETDRLLRLGCPEWAEPELVAVETVLRMIAFVFDHDERDAGGFCWADQIRSAPTLRRQWEKLRVWANRTIAGNGAPSGGDGGGVEQSWMNRSDG